MNARELFDKEFFENTVEFHDYPEEYSNDLGNLSLFFPYEDVRAVLVETLDPESDLRVEEYIKKLLPNWIVASESQSLHNRVKLVYQYPEHNKRFLIE